MYHIYLKKEKYIHFIYMCLCASLRSYCRSMWWNHLRFWYGSTMVNLTGSKKDGWWVGHAADPCPCWMINISPVHGSAGFWISSSCSIPMFFVGPIPMSAGKTKKQCVSICLSFYIMFLHPRSDYVTKKYSIYYIYRFLWVSSCFHLQGPLQGPPFQPSYRPCRHQHPQPWCRCHLPASASWKSWPKSWPVDAGGPVIKHGSGKVER